MAASAVSAKSTLTAQTFALLGSSRNSQVRTLKCPGREHFKKVDVLRTYVASKLKQHMPSVTNKQARQMRLALQKRDAFLPRRRRMVRTQLFCTERWQRGDACVALAARLRRSVALIRASCGQRHLGAPLAANLYKKRPRRTVKPQKF